MSSLLGGRRYASPARLEMILRAHGISSAAPVGRQTKILRRLGVSETPVTLYGPVTLKSRTCGRMVMPALSPYSVSASV